MLAMGCICGMGPVMPAGPSQGSGIGIVPHELHVSVHHLPHQLLQEGERQMRAPVQGQMGSMSGMPQSMTSPLAPHSGRRRGWGFVGPCPQQPWPRPCCALGCPSLPRCLLSSKQGSRQRHQKWGVSGCPGHLTQRCPPPFPSLQIAFRGCEHPAGTEHTRKDTHIKRDSRLPVQLLPGFGAVSLQKILWKRRERQCKDCYLPHPDGLPIAPASL